MTERTPVTGQIAPARRVLLVKLSSLGDVVHALPVARALRSRWPDMELTWAVERREQPILQDNPDVDHVVPVDTRLWRREFQSLPGAGAVVVKIRGLWRRLRAGRFDVAIDLQGLWKSGVIARLSGAPLRVGFAMRHCRERANALFTNRRVAVPDKAHHVVDANLALLRGLGMSPETLGPPVFPLPVVPGATAAVERFLEGEGVKPETQLVVLNPGSGGEGKRWEIEAYRRLADELALRLGARILVSWGPGEEPLARAIAHGLRTPALIPPATSVVEMVALMRRAALVVGSDTGPIHVAAVLGVPTVGLYGPTAARRNGPYGARTAAVQSSTGRMEDIPVEMVVTTVERLVR